MMDVQMQGENRVAVIHMRNGENRFNPDFVHALNDALDCVLNEHTQARALVITGNGKFFSNGLDLDWIGTHRAQVKGFFSDMFALLKRVLVFPVPTVAAINGHAFGAGFFLALVCDWRVQRSDRGYLCFPELYLGLPLSPHFNAIARGKLNKENLRDGVLLSMRFGAKDSLRRGIVHAIAPEAEVVGKAVTLANSLHPKKFDKDNLSVLKGEIYEDIVHGLSQPVLKAAL